MSSTTSEAVRDPNALGIPAKVCEPLFQPLIPNVRKHLYKLLDEEANEEKSRNIKAFISAFENGEEIGHDELLCKGKRMNWNDWQPTLGPYFRFPVNLRMLPFTVYQEFPGARAQQHIKFDITLSELVGGEPTGPMMRITALNDTGSDLMTLYLRDLNTLDPLNLFQDAIGPLLPVQTAAGIIQRQTYVGGVRLLNVEGNGYIGEWFREQFSMEPDTPVFDENGLPEIDPVGGINFVDFRLTGITFRRSFFKATGRRDGRLVISTHKSHLQPNLPA